MVTIVPEYEIGQKVFIKPFNIGGTVESYYYRDRMEYKVRYFDSGTVMEIYFYADELQALEE